MSFKEKLKEIDKLQQDIVAYGEWSPEVKQKVNYKFRLDWNYYSNAMEGNTLTKDETQHLMMGNVTVHGKPLKDVLEMKGHNTVIEEILKIGTGEKRISEKRIKDIHKGIMHEDDPKEEKKIGKWKEKPNHILNYKGERFDFTPPNEVEEQIHNLLNRTNAQQDAIDGKKKAAPHPVEVALQFHLDFVSIHPFYDGNGRTARILNNLLLIAGGYPPIIIKAGNERDNFMKYIADIQGYGAKPNLFYEFMTDLLIRSQKMVLDALEGKEIEEPDDIDKEIDLFKREFKGKKPLKASTNELIIEVYKQAIEPLFLKLIGKHKLIEDMFYSAHIEPVINGWLGMVRRNPIEHIDKYINDKDIININKPLKTINYDFFYNEFKFNDLNTFSCNFSVNVFFNKYTVDLFLDKTELITFKYNNPPNVTVIDELVSKIMQDVMKQIKSAYI